MTDPRAVHQSAEASDSATVVQAGRDIRVRIHKGTRVTGIVAIGGVIASATALVLAVNSPDTAVPATLTSVSVPPSPTATTTAPSPGGTSPTTPGEVPLGDLRPLGDAVLRDGIVVVDEVGGNKGKIAHLACTGGTAAPLEETYDLGGRYRTFTAKVAVDDEPRNAGPVTFTVLVDGEWAHSETLPVKSAENIEVVVAGALRMTLRTSAATCETVNAVWAKPILTR